MSPMVLSNTLIFPREGWECPSEIPNFERESTDPRSDGAWRFRSLWPACYVRQLEIERQEPCQKITIVMRCQKEGVVVQFQDCQSCLMGRAVG